MNIRITIPKNLEISGIVDFVIREITRDGLTASVHERPLMITPAAVWCNAC